MAYRTILLKGSGLAEIQDEANAGVAGIYPGCLLYISATDTVSLHAVANGPASPLFAKEDDLQGNTVSDAYTINNRVQFLRCKTGDIVAAQIAAHSSIAVGDWLVSNGAGYLTEFAPTSSGQDEYPNAIVARALEAVTTTTSTSLAKVLIV